eukprot:SRR837773.16614.p1 GENE.SRR837773.16614~~SRR837773.16614.p1  ORF type:complete len:190 (-),score=46.66 SRR837773.16614:59-628(-)
MKDKSGELLKSCYLNDIRVLDLTRMQYSRLRTHGVPPVGRFGHSVALSEDDAIVFGGYSGATKEVSQGVLFSLRDKVKGDTAADEPKDDCESNDYCITLRTADMTWVRNTYVGIPATRRYGHTATAIGPHLIIFGGWDGGKPLSDVVVLRDQSVSQKGDFLDGPVQDFPGDSQGYEEGGEDYELETGAN